MKFSEIQIKHNFSKEIFEKHFEKFESTYCGFKKVGLRKTSVPAIVAFNEAFKNGNYKQKIQRKTIQKIDAKPSTGSSSRNDNS